VSGKTVLSVFFHSCQTLILFQLFAVSSRGAEQLLIPCVAKRKLTQLAVMLSVDLKWTNYTTVQHYDLWRFMLLVGCKQQSDVRTQTSHKVIESIVRSHPLPRIRPNCRVKAFRQGREPGSTPGWVDWMEREVEVAVWLWPASCVCQ